MTELALFNWLKEFRYKDLEQSPDQYEGFDCFSEANKMLIELKCRSVHYEDLILEKSKYQYLMIKAELLGFTAWYINQTPLGISYHNLSKLKNIQWIKKELPKSTQFSNQTKIVKEITFLPINR